MFCFFNLLSSSPDRLYIYNILYDIIFLYNIYSSKVKIILYITMIIIWKINNSIFYWYPLIIFELNIWPIQTILLANENFLIYFLTLEGEKRKFCFLLIMYDNCGEQYLSSIIVKDLCIHSNLNREKLK